MSNKGFSLVELIVVIAIMAILVGVAVPVYTSYIEKAQEAADQQYLSGVVKSAQLFAAEHGLELERIAIAPVVNAEGGQGIELYLKDNVRVEDLSELYAMVGSYNTDTPYEHYYQASTTQPDPGTGNCSEHDWEVTAEQTCTTDGLKTCKNCGATEIIPSEGHQKGAFQFTLGNLKIYGCAHDGCDYQIVEPQGGLIG